MHDHYLKQALELAKIRKGFCMPNPSVGAVLVKNNKVITTGYHFQSGHSHAEVEALKKIKNAKDTILYVSLEPCCHFGKTPPCTNLIIEKGIKTVVYGARDPNPLVAKKSQKILEAAGVKSIYHPLPEIQTFYRSYYFWWKNKRPFVTAKLALSLDGKVSGTNGKRVNITGKAAQHFTHEQRKLSDAILTTAKTIQFDNPFLNVRLSKEKIKKPLYIIDSQLSTPLDAKIFSTTQSITIFYDEKISDKKLKLFLAKGVNCISVKKDLKGLDLEEVFKKIGEHGVQDLWVEAGGEFFSSLAENKLLQRAFLYVAPKWLGDKAQTAFKTGENIFQQVKNKEWRSLEEDALCEMIF